MIEINNLGRSAIPSAKLRRIAEDFMAGEKSGDKALSIAIVGDARMKRLNHRYRRKDRTTDILSFAGEDGELGELVISYPQAKRQARAAGIPVQDELVRILVHGLLHLLGHEDDTRAGAEKMDALARAFIRRTGA